MTNTSSNGTDVESWRQKFDYDRWGNRTINAAGTYSWQSGQQVSTVINEQQFAVNTANNRLGVPGGQTGTMTYDAAGNLIFDSCTTPGSGSRGYDTENRMTWAIGSSGLMEYYTYDPNGRRVRRKLGNGSEEWWQVYGIGGELVAEYRWTGTDKTLQKEYGYRSGQMLVIFDSTETGDNQLKWLVQDHLGSTRMVIDKSGSLAGIKRRDYLPFGEELAASLGHRAASGSGYAVDDKPRQKFTGHERDNETGLDFMQARYCASVQGRFTSPDEILADQTKSLPQSWNLYTYVRNNPLAYVDPSGRVTCRPDGTCIGDWDGEQNGKLFWNERKRHWETFQEFKTRRLIEAFARQLTLQEKHNKLFRKQSEPGSKMAAAGIILIRLPKFNPVVTAGLAGATIGYMALTWNHAPAPIPIGTVNYFNRPWAPQSPPLVIDPNIFARKADLELVDAIADEFDIPRDLLSDEIHDYKRKTGRKGSDNLGKEKIREIAKEIKDILDSSKDDK